MQVATGHYVNVFDVMGADVLLILNEPNSAPLPEEVGLLEAAVAKAIRGHVCADRDELEIILENLIENMKCECTSYGFQVIVKRLPRLWVKEYSDLQDQ